MPSEPDSKSLLLVPGPVAVDCTGGVTAVGREAACSGAEAAGEAVVKGREPCSPSLMAKRAETIRNIPATPAENQRRVWLTDRALGMAGSGVLLGAEFIE